ncbi:TAP-like protein-domain-containing protein [Xylogone sp. PMI_703]|nr:TAP-like protein-domain-containing protein [Xylogone sp. PMI_703]
MQTIAVLIAPFLAHIGLSRANTGADDIADQWSLWDQISPSTDLNFSSCYDGFECARLILPLDWDAPDDLSTISIAIIKLAASVPPSHPSYGDAIITNPGGPGGSGVQFLLQFGRQVQSIIETGSLATPDAEREAPNTDPRRYFDIISFDPRGVLFSSPSALCFTDPIVRRIWETQKHAQGNLDDNPATQRSMWARARAMGKFCNASGREGEGQAAETDIRRFMSTELVARDMLAITERLEKLSHSCCALSDGAQFPVKQKGDSQVEAKGPMLNYWGVSYGTILGMTFASMFPHKVGRMVLDGVMDPYDYVRQEWKQNLNDAETVMKAFYQQCFNAGETCDLFNPLGPHAIEDNLLEILKKLKDQPLPVLGSSDAMVPEIITYSDVKWLIFFSIYDPVDKWPLMARALSQLREGNATDLINLLGFKRPLQLSTYCGQNNKTKISYEGSFDEVGMAILCSDGDDMSKQTFEDFQLYQQQLEHQSPSIGAIWARIRLACTGWKIRSKSRFTGPFEGNTYWPILWLGNRADPVTPISNAKRMAKSFPGSVVLQQECEGHNSFAAPSKCVRRYVSQYFSSGRLPPANTVCDVEARPFHKSDAVNRMMHPMQCDGSCSNILVIEKPRLGW